MGRNGPSRPSSAGSVSKEVLAELMPYLEQEGIVAGGPPAPMQQLQEAVNRAAARYNASLPPIGVTSQRPHPDAAFSLDRLASMCIAMVDALVEDSGRTADRAWVDEQVARLRPGIADSVVEVLTKRQPMWLLTNWVLGIGSLTPAGAVALKAVEWVERHAGEAAADLVMEYAGAAGHPDAPAGSLILDQDRTEHIPAWLMLLAGATASRGEENAQWLRRFDPVAPDPNTLAWLEDRVDPNWTPPAPPAPTWPPDPKLLPEIRRKQITYLTHPDTHHLIGGFAHQGVISFSPATPNWIQTGRLLCDQEADRLAKARLYFVDSDMGHVAARKAARARSTPLTTHRVPSPNGLLVFAEPITLSLPSTSERPGTASRRPQTPISTADLVAISWGRFDPSTPASGWRRFDEDDQTHLPARFGSGEHWWLTLYHQVADDGLWADTPVPPLEASAEHILTTGLVFDAPPQDQAEHGARILVACWDLITQEYVGKPVTQTQPLPRKPTKVRADRRRGITDNGTVHLVTILGRPAPPAPAGKDADGERPGQQSSVQYRHRWTVQEHSRSHCMNPRGHTDGDCVHEDITIMDFIKGPAGAPLLRRDIVHLLRKRERQQ
ncbi:hypothetical protein ACIQC7_17500 [Kitasatospora sp. NPDC088556]